MSDAVLSNPSTGATSERGPTRSSAVPAATLASRSACRSDPSGLARNVTSASSGEKRTITGTTVPGRG